MDSNRPKLLVRWLGRVSYGDGLALQQALVADRRAGRVADTLLLLEHPPVITQGRGSDPAHLLAGAEELRRLGIEHYECGRGGDVTFHGPGQLVGYPIVALEPTRRDAHRYLRDLEEALIRTAADYGLTARRTAGLTGVWVNDRKLAAIGVRLSTGWVTSHGFALNVTTDLSAFSTIVPCGISGRGVTSLEAVLGCAPSLQEAAARTASHLATVLEREPTAPERAVERLALTPLRALSSVSGGSI
jgi:lipoyl(octanoyl) transferase